MKDNQTDDRYQYFYPNNLEETPLVLFWQINDSIIITFLGLIALFILLHYKFIYPLAGVLAYACLKIQFDSSSRSVMDYLTTLYNYIGETNEWEYQPIEDLTSERVKQAKKKKKNKRKDKAKQEGFSEFDISNEKVLKSKEKRKRELNLIEDEQEKHNTSGASFVVKYLPMLIAVLAIVALGGYIILDQYAGGTDFVDLTLDYAESTDINWYSGSIDPLSFVKSSNGTVTADPETIDSTILGPVDVTYTVTDDNGNKKTFTREYNVVDNEAPIITLKADTVNISAGTTYNPALNIESVSDRIDGALTATENPSFSSYVITSDVDTNIPGTYTVSIAAYDSNGNETDASFNVVVEENEDQPDQPVVEPTEESPTNEIPAETTDPGNIQFEEAE